MGITPALENQQSQESSENIEKKIEDQEWLKAMNYIIKEQGVELAEK